MKKFIVATIAVLFGAVALAAPLYGVLTAAEVGLNVVNLADTPVSSSVSMDPRVIQASGTHYNQLTVICQVTWGTSTKVDFMLYESMDDTLYAARVMTNGANPGLSEIYKQRYALADFGDGKVNFNIGTNAPYVKVSLDDPDDGTGTAICSVKRGLH